MLRELEWWGTMCRRDGVATWYTFFFPSPWYNFFIWFRLLTAVHDTVLCFFLSFQVWTFTFRMVLSFFLLLFGIIRVSGILIDDVPQVLLSFIRHIFPHFWRRWDLDGYSCLFVWICLYHLRILTSILINSTPTRYSLLFWLLVLSTYY